MYVGQRLGQALVVRLLRNGCCCLRLLSRAVLQLVSSDVVAPLGVDSIRVCSNFMFVGMSREDEGIVKVYNLAAGGASHQLTGHKVRSRSGVLQYAVLCCIALAHADLSHSQMRCVLAGDVWYACTLHVMHSCYEVLV